MKIFLYDSLQRRKREFIPLDEKMLGFMPADPLFIIMLTSGMRECQLLLIC